MDDPFFMRDFEGLGDLPRETQDLCDRQPATLLLPARLGRELLCERVALDQLENQEANIVRFLETVDRADVGMVQRGEHPRFAVEARESIRMPRERRRQNLDRDVAPELRVVRTVHFAHAAGAEQRVQAIPADRPAGHLCPCGRRPGGRHWNRVDTWRGEKSVVRRLVQQRFDLAPQRLVVSTRLGEKRRAFAGWRGVGRVIQLLDPLPAFRRHGARSRPAHARPPDGWLQDGPQPASSG